MRTSEIAGLALCVGLLSTSCGSEESTTDAPEAPSQRIDDFASGVSTVASSSMPSAEMGESDQSDPHTTEPADEAVETTLPPSADASEVSLGSTSSVSSPSTATSIPPTTAGVQQGKDGAVPLISILPTQEQLPAGWAFLDTGSSADTSGTCVAEGPTGDTGLPSSVATFEHEGALAMVAVVIDAGVDAPSLFAELVATPERCDGFVTPFGEISVSPIPPSEIGEASTGFDLGYQDFPGAASYHYSLCGPYLLGVVLTGVADELASPSIAHEVLRGMVNRVTSG